MRIFFSTEKKKRPNIKLMGTQTFFQQFKSFDITLLSPLPCMANCICCVYLYTYCGNETNDSFADISELLYQSDWFRQPQHVQQTILLMMQNAQQGMFYATFGGFPLNMDTFGRVISTYFPFPPSIEKHLISFSSSLSRHATITTWCAKHSRQNKHRKRKVP